VSWHLRAPHGLCEFVWYSTTAVRPQAAIWVTRDHGRARTTRTFFTLQALLAHLWWGVLLGTIRQWFTRVPYAGPWMLHPERGAVAVDSNSGVTAESGAAATTLNLTTFTMGTVSNGALVGMCCFNKTSISAVTMHWDTAATNQLMTQVATGSCSDSSDDGFFFALLGPTAGNKTLGLTWTTTAQAFIGAVSFSGVDQGSVAGSFNHVSNATGTSTTPAVTITSAANNYTFGMEVCGNSGTTATPATQVNNTSGSSTDNMAASVITGAASVAYSWTVSPSNPWAAFGCNIAAVGTVGGTDQLDFLRKQSGEIPRHYIPTIQPVP
jgi:hypothetical protein